MSDIQFVKFKQLGGPEWLRNLLDMEIEKDRAAMSIARTMVATKVGIVQSVWRHIVR